MNKRHLSLTIDFKEYQRNDINKYMDYFAKQIDEKIYYSIENKRGNNTPHIHGVMESSQPIPTIKSALKATLYSQNHDLRKSWDVEGWVRYMTKEMKDVYISEPQKPIFW